MITIKFLSENRTGKPGFLAEHGLSIYIETLEKKILFDTGATGTVMLHNADRLELDLEDIDAVVISHGHYDHTQGVPAFCKKNDSAKVYVHQDAFYRTYAIENGKLEDEQCGIRWTISQFDEIRNRLCLTKDVKKITDDIVISGTIPTVKEEVPSEKFYIKGENGNLLVDAMQHEQMLIIRDREKNDTSKGIYIFSGCSHKGVISCISYAKQLFPDELILGFIGGMHLYQASEIYRKQVIEKLQKEQIKMVIPVHCTGIEAICELKERLKDSCIMAGSGDSFILE